MKFGRDLPRNQVPEWASAYINYKGLKQLIKTAVEQAKRGEKADTAGMVRIFLLSFMVSDSGQDSSSLSIAIWKTWIASTTRSSWSPHGV